MGAGQCAKELTRVVVDVSALHREKRAPEIFGKGLAVLWAMADEDGFMKVGLINAFISLFKCLS